MDVERTERTFDLVVWGATGYTGRLVAEELARTAGSTRWAIAGRDRGRLETCRSGLADGGSRPEILVADLDDPASLRTMTALARVVLSTVGPYARFGTPMVEACIATATHLCDITGEVAWVTEMRRSHGHAAVDAGIRIVSMCGYDSVPSELGVHLMQSRLHSTTGRYGERIEMAVGPIKGGVSGGTIASAAHHVSSGSASGGGVSPAMALCVDPEPATGRGVQIGLRRSRLLRMWTAPFVMAGVNVAVVHRSHELLGRPWGPTFHYGEASRGGRGLGGFLRAIGITLATWCFVAAFFLSPTRALLRRFWLPVPGDGPNAASRAAGFFRHRVASSSLELEIAADIDPGYEATAVMLVACGRGILEDAVVEGAPSGFCTPVAVLGTALAERLEERGFSFEWSDRTTAIT